MNHSQTKKSSVWSQEGLMAFVQSSTFKYILAAVLLIGVAKAGWFGYRFYAQGKEAEAQRALTQCYAQCDAIEKEKNPDWAAAEKFCQLAYEQHSKTNAAPYILSMKTDILLRQDKKEEALEAMNKAIDALSSSSSPVYYIYRTKRAMMNIDSGKQDAGLAELQSLSQDSRNKNFDEAAYYLGLYHWQANELDQAKQAWAQLNKLEVAGEGASPWAARAQEKLKLL